MVVQILEQLAILHEPLLEPGAISRTEGFSHLDGALRHALLAHTASVPKPPMPLPVASPPATCGPRPTPRVRPAVPAARTATGGPPHPTPRSCGYPTAGPWGI